MRFSPAAEKSAVAAFDGLPGDGARHLVQVAVDNAGLAYKHFVGMKGFKKRHDYLVDDFPELSCKCLMFRCNRKPVQRQRCLLKKYLSNGIP